MDGLRQERFRRIFLFGMAAVVLMFGVTLAIVFGLWTWNLFDKAIDTGGDDAVRLVRHLAGATQGILSWIVFGITMTNAVVISSSLSVVMMIPRSSNGPEQPKM